MADVTIRGAGIFGLSIAWACIERGAKVRLVDPNGIAAGASGGIVGALAPHVPENWNEKKQFQLDSLLMAQPFWDRVSEAGGQAHGYAQLGRLQPVADAHALDLARKRTETAGELWKEHATWRVGPDAHGWQVGSNTGQFVFDTLSARIHPRKACLALAAALREKGVILQPEAPDTGPTIWATGVAGLEAIANTRPVGSGVKGQAALLSCDIAGRPQLFVDALHVVPHADGTVAVGSTSERDYDDPCSTDAALDTLLEKARTLVPELRAAKLVARWAGIRPRSRSRAPMLGAWPSRHGHFIANGGFKIGFGMAPKVAVVMADLVLEQIDRIPESFSVAASL